MRLFMRQCNDTGSSAGAEPGTLALTRPRLIDVEWLADAVERASSSTIAAELGVSAGTVREAYRRVRINLVRPLSTMRGGGQDHGQRSLSLALRGRAREPSEESHVGSTRHTPPRRCGSPRSA